MAQIGSWTHSHEFDQVQQNLSHTLFLKQLQHKPVVAVQVVNRGPVLTKLCKVLDHVLAFHKDHSSWNNTLFHAVKPPKISLINYCFRLVDGLNCSDQVMLLALVYIMRMEQRLGHGVLCPLSAHRMLLTSVVIAIKFHEDVLVSTKHIASVGGVSTNEICRLESEFLSLLDFRVMVTEDEFEALKQGLFKAQVSSRPDPLRQSF
eukprot:c8906_g1_i1.p1 GENE.c8906_g1_i1~~c8906_g1_i1.p1  ORF type:complete len:227 (-),score=34.57 c8906_g1_i1:149-763(-)